MEININGINQKCHRCGSNDLDIINYDEYEKAFVIWCNHCEEQTMEDVIKIDKINSVNLWMSIYLD